MQKTAFGKLKKRDTKILVVAIVAVIIAIVVALFLLLPPQRSVEAYCKAYKEENAKLANAQGDTYAVAVFSHKSSNPADFANAFGKLERVAPNEIQSDVKTLKQIFEKINSDPSQAMGASLSGIGAESNVKKWTNDHCTQ